MINIKENKKAIIKSVLFFIISCALALITELFLYEKIINIWNSNIDYEYWSIYDPNITFSKIRLGIFFIFYMFISLHFIFNIKKIYLFICDNRYKLAAIFLLLVTVLQINGSSMQKYDRELSLKTGIAQKNILGVSRGVRSDEWSTQSAYILSQETSNFAFNADKLRGTETDMFSLVAAPAKSPLMLGRPFQIGFLFLNADSAFSLYWYARITLMLLITFEMMMILTNKKKILSLVGSILIGFSAAVQWWYCMDSLIWGQVILVLFNLFFRSDKKYVKVLCGIGEIVGILSFIFVLYPAWQVSFAYVFAILFVYIIYNLIKDKKLKVDVLDVSIICVAIIIIYACLGLWLIQSHGSIEATMSTDYPGERISVGGNEKSLLGYFYNMFMPYEKFEANKDNPIDKRIDKTIETFENQCENATMLSFYPLPIIMALIYLIKTKKKDIFLILSVIVSAILSIYCIVGLPEFLSKLTLLSMSMGNRATVALAALNIYILIYLISKVEEEQEFKFFDKKIIPIIISIIMTVICIFLDGNNYLRDWEFGFSIIVFAILFYMIFNIDNKKIRNIFILSCAIITLIGGITVNPVIKTVGMIKSTELSNMLEKYAEAEPDKVWITNRLPGISNYMVANGLRTLTSTNVYPNKEFYEKLLGEKAYDEDIKFIWNRYHHIQSEIYDGPTTIRLMTDDSVEIKINYKDLNKIGVDYILTKVNLEIEQPYMNIQIIEVLDGFIVYKVFDQNEEENIIQELKEYKEKMPDSIWISDELSEKESKYLEDTGIKSIITESLDLNKNISKKLLDITEESFTPVAPDAENNVQDLPVIKTTLKEKYNNIKFRIYDGETQVLQTENNQTIINLNYKDLNELGIDYIITKRNLKIENPYMNLEEIEILCNKFVIYKVGEQK